MNIWNEMTTTVYIYQLYQWWLFALKSTICKVHRLCLKPQGQALIIYGLTWFSDVMVIKLNILWQAVNNLISWEVQDHLITTINMWNYIYCNNDYRNISIIRFARGYDLIHTHVLLMIFLDNLLILSMVGINKKK